MTDTKKAPTAGTVKGRGQKTNLGKLYSCNHSLSTAAQILLLVEQCPDHADRLRQACWDRLDAVLRRHYESRAAQ